MTNRLLRFLSVFSLLIAGALCASAGFVIHDVKGAVKIIKGKTEKAATKGEVVSPADQVNIPAGGEIRILNDVNGIIYISTSTGRMPISRMMVNADKESADHTRSVGREVRLGKNSGDSRVYVEKGMVKRSLSDYDPDASGLEIQPDVLAMAIFRAIGGEQPRTPAAKGLAIAPLAATDSLGNGFDLINRAEFPVYFNVLKITDGSAPKAGISPLGQPSGSYVVLPGQTMRRSDAGKFPSTERHLLVATGCQFDVDGLTDALNTLLANPPAEKQPLLEIPLSIIAL